MTTKIDLKKAVPSYTARAGRFDELVVPPMRYLMITGHGDPNTGQEYADALATLYPVAYTLKFASKNQGRDYVVPPLEALWWSDDMAAFTAGRDKSRWDWTAMLLVPDWITTEQFTQVRDQVAASKPVPAVDKLRFEILDEGTCIQTLHLGSFDDEGPVLAHLHDEVIPERGFVMTGRHHEVYFCDPRRTAPEKLRTILRQPVARASLDLRQRGPGPFAG